MLVYSTLLLLVLCSGCVARQTRSQVQALEQHTEAIHLQHEGHEQAMLEDVACEEEWGSDGSPTTFRRVRIRRRAHEGSQALEVVHQQTTEATAHVEQATQVATSSPRGYRWVMVSIAISYWAEARVAEAEVRLV